MSKLKRIRDTSLKDSKIKISSKTASKIDPESVAQALGAVAFKVRRDVLRSQAKSLLATLTDMRQDALNEASSWWGEKYVVQMSRQQGVVEGLNMAIALIKKRTK